MHRTKYYLVNALKIWARNLKPQDFYFSEDFKLEVRGEGSNYVMLSIKDPSDGGLPHYFEIKVTEKI